MIVEDCVLRYRCDQCHEQMTGFNAALTHARRAHTIDKGAQTEALVSVPTQSALSEILDEESVTNCIEDDDDKADNELETSGETRKIARSSVHKRKGDRYSSEIKARAVELYENGMNMERIAAELGVATSWTISRWLARASVAKHRPKTASPSVFVKRNGTRRSSKGNTYTPEERQRAVDLYKSGMNMSRIAAKLGVNSVWTISRWLTAANEKQGNRDKVVYTREQRERALQMFNEGASASAVAKEFGCTAWTASKWWRQAYEQSMLRRDETAPPRKHATSNFADDAELNNKAVKQETNTTLL